MSKQYLTTHTLEEAHPTDIFAFASAPGFIISGSGASSLQIHALPPPNSASETAPRLVQTITGAHKLGCHHVAASANGDIAVSAGFGGEVKLWRRQGYIQGNSNNDDIKWVSLGTVTESQKGAGEVWAVAISSGGEWLAGSSYDGRLRIWDLRNSNNDKEWPLFRDYETKGSFGMCIALSSDAKFAASGHENGSIFLFNNESGRLIHSLSGQTKAIRAVAFSPAITLVAAAGDARVIGLYDVSSGEQIASLSGHTSWIMSLDFSIIGDWLLSGSYDGKTKVWGMETRSCVATHGESEKPVWCVKWLLKPGRSEMFAVSGANKSISIYREASGGV